MFFDKAGRLYVTQVPFGSGGIAIIYPPAAKKTLVNNYEGKPFGRANDLTVNSKGGVYFSDSANAAPMPQGGPPLPAALYYLPPDATRPIQLLHDVAFPNGLVLSGDEKTLYLNNTNGEYMLAFDVQPDGTLTNRRNFAKYDGVTQTRRRAGERRRRPHDRQPGPFVCRLHDGRAGVQPAGPASRHHTDAATAAESLVRRRRQEDALRRRPRRRLQGADDRAGPCRNGHDSAVDTVRPSHGLRTRAGLVLLGATIAACSSSRRRPPPAHTSRCSSVRRALGVT
jgi:hypothetical protein